MKQIKVLFITHVNQMGGANRSMFQLIKELKNYYLVIPYALCPDYTCSPSIVEKLNEIGVPVIRTEIRYFKAKNPHIFREGRQHLRFLWNNRRLYRKLREYKFDIIHSNSSVIDLGAYLSILLNVKHVWHLREYGDIDFNLYSVLGSFYEHLIYKRADAYVAISKSIEEYFASKVYASKMHLIYNGISPSNSAHIAEHTNNVCRFVCAGNISEGKNQMEILEAVCLLIKRSVRNFHITIVGISEEPYTSKIREFVSTRHLDSYVTLLPEQDGVELLFSAMDVGLMTSKAEAFGRVTVEYQLQNLLVIANDGGANPELICDGKTGFLYPMGNSEVLADKMQQAIENPERLKQIARNGMENAKMHFLSQFNTRGIYQLYCKLIEP